MTECSELETFAALLERALNNTLGSDNLFTVLGLLAISAIESTNMKVSVLLSLNVV